MALKAGMNSMNGMNGVHKGEKENLNNLHEEKEKDKERERARLRQEEEDRFEKCDMSSRAELLTLMPNYFQEKMRVRASATGKKSTSLSFNAVHIEDFTMKTPFGDQTLLSYTTLSIEPNKRQCLFGANSSGKTLLFSLMAGGSIREFPKHVHVYHCKELEGHQLSDTVLNTVVESHPLRRVLVKCREKLKRLLADPSSLSSSQLEGLKANQEFVDLHMRSIRGDDAVERAAAMLRVLGFDDIGQNKLCSALSGGLRMRVALAMAFFVDADLLLLDEPTNHLDFPSVLWLENRLRGYGAHNGGSFILVSHDRELLNNVCTSVLLLADKQITYYNCGFKEFEKQKAASDKKKYDEVEAFLAKNRNVDPSSMLGRQKYDNQQWRENYLAKQMALAGKFTFPTAVPLAGSTPGEPVSLIDLKDVRFSYDVNTGHFIFNDPISFLVNTSTRVGVMGPNGAGKSTLLKLLTGKLTPTSGTVVTHPTYKLAYFGQHSTLELDLSLTPSEFMAAQFPSDKPGLLRSHLAKTSIAGPVADTRMARLSFSQRSCVIFAKLTYVCPHLLIMDEPTNFLDLESVDALISACNKYPGALLLVSHNRDFLRKCVNKYASVVPGKFAIYDGLKKAEQATYTFIEDMESGAKVGKDLLAKNPGGGSIHASQIAASSSASSSASASSSSSSTASPAPSTPGVKVISLKSSAPATSLAAAAIQKEKEKEKEKEKQKEKDRANERYAVNEKCLCLGKDGKYSSAIVKKVDGQKYTVAVGKFATSFVVTALQLQKMSKK